jgi:hypothetical protein
MNHARCGEEFAVVFVGGVMLLVTLMALAIKALWSYGRAWYDRAAGQRLPEVLSAPFWRWQTILTYLIALLVVERLLSRLGADPHDQPLPFVLFGLSFGLLLCLMERRRTEGHGPKGRE